MTNEVIRENVRSCSAAKKRKVFASLRLLRLPRFIIAVRFLTCSFSTGSCFFCSPSALTSTSADSEESVVVVLAAGEGASFLL